MPLLLLPQSASGGGGGSTVDYIPTPVKPKRPVLQRGHPLARGLVGAWPLWERGGATVYGGLRGRDGSIQGGAGWVSSVIGPGVDLDGTNDYLDCGASSALNPTTAISAFCWFRFDTFDTSSNENWLFGRDDETDGRAYAFGVKDTGGGSSHKLMLQINGSVVFSTSSQALDPLLGQVLSLGFTGSPATGYRGYLKGREEDNGSWTVPNATTGPTSWGRRSYAGNEGYCNGQMFGAHLWNRALTPYEVRRLHEDPWGMYRWDWQREPVSDAAAAAATLFRRNIQIRTGSRGAYL